MTGREYLLIASYKYFCLIIVISLNIDKEIQVIVLVLEQSGYIGEGYYYLTGTLIPRLFSVKSLYTEGQTSGSSAGKKWPDLGLDLTLNTTFDLTCSAKKTSDSLES